MDNQPNIPSQPEQSISNTSQERGRSRVIVYVIITLIVAGVAFAAAYFWQKSKNDNTLTKLNNTSAKVSQLERQISGNTEQADSPVPKEESSTITTNPDLIPGDTDTRRDDGRILITTVFKYSLEPTAVWVEYGTDPSNLNKSTTKLTKGLGEGDPSATFAQGFSVAISNSELEPGTTYYYRVAATVKGQTERSAVASFVTNK